VSVFGERLDRFSKKIPRDPTNNRLIDQLAFWGALNLMFILSFSL